MRPQEDAGGPDEVLLSRPKGALVIEALENLFLDAPGIEVILRPLASIWY
jgi:hypothetical protein